MTQRTRQPRRGVSVYFPTVEDAEIARRLIGESVEARALMGRTVTDVPLRAITEALERRKRKDQT